MYYSMQDKKPPNPGPSANNPMYPGILLREGSRGDAVRVMQEYLARIAQAYGQIPNTGADGIYGPRTATAVRAFQRVYGLNSDGIIGPASWSKIVEVYNTLPAEYRLNYGDMSLIQSMGGVLLSRMLMGDGLRNGQNRAGNTEYAREYRRDLRR
jgi:peptidoglycan hydrolase-like protein with peptidoglycan-binding domain